MTMFDWLPVLTETDVRFIWRALRLTQFMLLYVLLVNR